MTSLLSKLTTGSRRIVLSTARNNTLKASIVTSLSVTKHRQQHEQHKYYDKQQERNVFTFAGARNLNDILKLELIHNRTKIEVSDLWLTYHESKENVAGLIISNGKVVKDMLSRASKSPYFVQPVFRENGFFMLVSQFISPTHFLFAYLEDYKMDPNRAQPLLTFSVFDDLCHDKDLGLVRCDIVNKGITHNEGIQIVQNTIDSYAKEGEYSIVKTFNSQPGNFDVEDYIAIQRRKWNMDTKATTISTTDNIGTK